MPHHISKIDNSHIIMVVYEGEIDFDERTQIFQTIITDYKQKAIYKLLIDYRLANLKASKVEQTIFARFLTSELKFKHAAIAILDNEPQNGIYPAIKDNVQLTQYRVKQFSDELEALNWLNSI